MLFCSVGLLAEATELYLDNMLDYEAADEHLRWHDCFVVELVNAKKKQMSPHSNVPTPHFSIQPLSNLNHMKSVTSLRFDWRILGHGAWLTTRNSWWHAKGR